MPLPPLPDYRATRVRSLTLYRQRIAELFDFERARARVLAYGAVESVAREIDPRVTVAA
jgi:hypothetical protein